MYKAKLQEICQKNTWTAPEYTRQKYGPDHNPRFSGSVVVNGLNFDTTELFKNAREAQNEAARLAFLHFTSSAGSSTSDIDQNSAATPEKKVHPRTEETSETPHYNGDTLVERKTAEHEDLRHMYKNQLQTYTQKKNITLPTYYCERDGPIHASRFKARVVVDGKTFEATEYCNSIKEAEHAAAKVALKSLALDGIKEDDLGLYKNLLQELAQKESFNLPEYNTSRTGKSHMPVFVSTVKVNGEIYYGPQSKTKKQAEMGAAKVAYNCLKENECVRSCKRRYLSAQAHEAHEVALFPMQLNVGLDGEQNVSLKSPSIIDQSTARCKHRDLNAQGHEAHEAAISPVQLNVGLDGEQNVSLKSPSIIDQSAAYKDLPCNPASGTLFQEIILSTIKLYEAFSKVKEPHYVPNTATPVGSGPRLVSGNSIMRGHEGRVAIGTNDMTAASTAGGSSYVANVPVVYQNPVSNNLTLTALPRETSINAPERNHSETIFGHDSKVTVLHQPPAMPVGSGPGHFSGNSVMTGHEGQVTIGTNEMDIASPADSSSCTANVLVVYQPPLSNNLTATALPQATPIDVPTMNQSQTSSGHNSNLTVLHQPLQEFRVPRGEMVKEEITCPMEFVAPSPNQSGPGSTSGKKRKQEQ